MMRTEIEKTYNEIPYMSKSFGNTHPFHLKTSMELLSFETPDIKKARVLEIGCSFGGNIIPIALNYPETEVYGIDLSSVQIEKGKEIIEYIGLENIKLINKNLLDFENDLGKFDYIICHGIYSWVPENVKDKILKVIKENLSDNGVAIISYNTYPGWAKYDVYKNIMKFRVDYMRKKGVEISNKEKLNYGKGALEFIEKYSYLPKEFKESVKNIIDKDDYYLLHEYYEEYNQPIYLYDFNNELLKNDLFHICDSNLKLTFKSYGNDEALNLIDKECQGDLLGKEQYYDYLYNTQFRSSIITHVKNKEKLNLTEKFDLQNFNKLYISGSFSKKDDKWIIHGKEIELKKEETIELINYLNNIYPENVSVKEILEKFGMDLKSDLLYMIINGSLDVFPYKVKKRGSKLKLNPKILRYLEKCLEPSNVINVSNYKGQICEIDNYLIEILKKIDNEITEKKLEKEILKMFENKELIVDVEEKEYKKVVQRLINEVKAFLNLFLI